MTPLAPQGYDCFGFAGQVIQVEWADEHSAAWVAWLSSSLPAVLSQALPGAVFRLHSSGGGQMMTLFEGGDCLYRGTDLPRGLHTLLEAMMAHWRCECRDGLLLHAGMVAKGDRGVLLAGPSGAGKSTLSAWLCAQGWVGHGDEWVHSRAQRCQGLRRPWVLKGDWRSLLPPQCELGTLASEVEGRSLVPASAFGAGGDAGPLPASCAPSLILFPRYQAGSAFEFRRLSPARATLGLMEVLLNGPLRPHGGLPELAALARLAPAYELHYGDFNQLEPVLSMLREPH